MSPFARLAALLLVALTVVGCKPSQVAEAIDRQTAAAQATQPTAGPRTPVMPPGFDPPSERATVTRLIDGDTVEVSNEAGARAATRIVGVDTPETKKPRTPVQCGGPEASAMLAGLIPVGTPVVLVYDLDREDQYGRLLAYVERESDGLDVGRALVVAGLARWEYYSPNRARLNDYVQAEAFAEGHGLGVWSACPDVEQWATSGDHRKLPKDMQ